MGSEDLVLVAALATEVVLTILVTMSCSQTRVIRSGVGFLYPAYKSLHAIMSDDREAGLAWMRYWVVLAVFSMLGQLLTLSWTSSLATSSASASSWSGAWRPRTRVAQTWSSLRSFSPSSRNITRKLISKPELFTTRSWRNSANLSTEMEN